MTAPVPHRTSRSSGERVLGLDVAGRLGWVGVIIDGGGFVDVAVGSMADVVARAGSVAVVGADIPIGGAAGHARRCDAEARRFVGPRASSVFSAPTISEPGASYADANAALAAAGRPKLSRQAWALLPRMREAADAAATDDRILEVHPEVSFRAMADEPLIWPKKSWNGQALRRGLLATQGIVLPDELPVIGGVPADDLLDAAAVAWSARRVAQGGAHSLPDPPERHAGRSVAIWY